MKGIQGFDEFVKKNIVKKQSINKSRAGFLIKESAKGYKNLLEKIEKIQLTDDNANDFIKSSYDLLMEIIRAKMLLQGYNACGAGAHEAEVAYMRVLGFSEVEVQFVDQMRYFRNGILYYGTSLDKEYAKKVLGFTKKVYFKLKTLLKGLD